MKEKKDIANLMRLIQKKKGKNEGKNENGLLEVKEKRKKEKKCERGKEDIADENKQGDAKEEEECVQSFLEAITESEQERFESSDFPAVKKIVRIFSGAQNRKSQNEVHKYVYDDFEDDINQYLNNRIKEVIFSISAPKSLRHTQKLEKLNYLSMVSTNIQKGFYDNLETHKLSKLQNAAVYFEATTWDDINKYKE